MSDNRTPEYDEGRDNTSPAPSAVIDPDQNLKNVLDDLTRIPEFKPHIKFHEQGTTRPGYHDIGAQQAAAYGMTWESLSDQMREAMARISRGERPWRNAEEKAEVFREAYSANGEHPLAEEIGTRMHELLEKFQQEMREDEATAQLGAQVSSDPRLKSVLQDRGFWPIDENGRKAPADSVWDGSWFDSRENGKTERAEFWRMVRAELRHNPDFAVTEQNRMQDIYGSLPEGHYWVKDPQQNGAPTTPIRVDATGRVEVTPPKGLPPRVEYTDADARVTASLAERFKNEDEVEVLDPTHPGSTSVKFEDDPKKMMVLGLSIIGAIIAIVVLIILAAVNAGGDDPESEPSPMGDNGSPAEVSTTDAAEETSEPEPESTVAEDAVPISELENEWFLGTLETVGVDTLGYTDEELMQMGRDTCGALDANGGDVGLLAAQLAILLGDNESEVALAGSIMGAAVTAYCPEYADEADAWMASN